MIEFIQTYYWIFIALIFAGIALDDVCVRLDIFEVIAPPLSLAMINLGAAGTLVNAAMYVSSTYGE